MEIRAIGIVGGGTMGAGIIQTLSHSGYPVHFKEINAELVTRCLGQVERIYLSAQKKGKIGEEDVRKGLSLIRGGTGDEGFDQVDLVIEAVPEHIEIKKAVFQNLDRICKPETILATNTSSLSITEIGNFTTRSSRVVGMHWFNPPQVMKLVEVIPGLETSEEAIECLIQFSRKLGKVPIRVKECAGFVVNRLLGIYINEAIFLLEEGEKPTVIDQAALQAGMPMGPLRLGDMVGWDVIYRSNQTLCEEYGARFKLPKLLCQMVEQGRLGQKAGLGIYLSESEKPEVPEEVSDPEKPLTLSNRLLFVMMNEGIRCLEEGVASVEDIDRALQLGAGMPKGPIAWTDEVGLDTVFTELDQLKIRYGERFRPSPFLRRKVSAGHLGKKSGKGFFLYPIG